MEKLKTVLFSALDNLGIKEKVEKNLAIVYWERIAGEQIARHTQARLVKGDILFVSTDSPVWAQELGFVKDRLVRKINRHLKGEKIKEIRFQPRGLAKDGNETAPN